MPRKEEVAAPAKQRSPQRVPHAVYARTGRDRGEYLKRRDRVDESEAVVRQRCLKACLFLRLRAVLEELEKVLYCLRLYLYPTTNEDRY